MNSYSMNRVFDLLIDMHWFQFAGIEFWEHRSIRGAMLYFERSSRPLFVACSLSFLLIKTRIWREVLFRANSLAAAARMETAHTLNADYCLFKPRLMTIGIL